MRALAIILAGVLTAVPCAAADGHPRPASGANALVVYAADGSDRDFDWHRIRDILAKTGFRGFLSVEYEGEDGDEVSVVQRIAKFLKTLR